MRLIFATLILLLLATCASIAPSESSAALMSRIDKEGGSEVLHDLWEHETEFNQVTSRIESGDADWLQVAARLLPFADGATSLSLHYAVARALPKEPNRVLALVGHGFDAGYICTSPFIEPDPGVAEAYERQTLAALASIKDPALRPIAAECSKGVRLP